VRVDPDKDDAGGFFVAVFERRSASSGAQSTTGDGYEGDKTRGQVGKVQSDAAVAGVESHKTLSLSGSSEVTAGPASAAQSV
jgi:hypothetical protein